MDSICVGYFIRMPYVLSHSRDIHARDLFSLVRERDLLMKVGSLGTY